MGKAAGKKLVSLGFLLFIVSQTILSQKVDVAKFGFNISPSKAIMAAFKSTNDTLLITKQSKPWVIEPLALIGINNKVLMIEEGVKILAKPGAFPKTGNSLFLFRNCSNISIMGNGALMKMNKEEYLDGEWRHVLSLWNCSDFYIEKLTLCDSGGDGIFIDGVSDGEYSENITIKEILSTNNKRQGISIISAKNVFVHNSIFQNTIGTLPGAGVDLEPDTKFDCMENINFYDCTFKNNYNAGIKITLEKLETDSAPVSILFKNCLLQNNFSELNQRVAGEITIGAHNTMPVQGSLKFEGCLIENSLWGLFYSRKVSNAYNVIFKECTARNICNKGTLPVMYLEVPDYFTGEFSLGGYQFENFVLDYNTAVPLMKVRGSRLNTLAQFADITGDITLLGELPKKYEYIKYNPINNKNVDLKLHYRPIKVE